MDEMNDPPKIINFQLKNIKSEPITSTLVIKPIPINKSTSISPEPLLKKLRLI
jgi:hypothetical protein